MRRVTIGHSTYNISEIPKKGETFLDHAELNISMIASVDLYIQNSECLIHKHDKNWLCTIIFFDGDTLNLKLPIEMPEQDVLDYFKPIISHLKSCDMRQKH